jgi:hypothetical protein
MKDLCARVCISDKVSKGCLRKAFGRGKLPGSKAADGQYRCEANYEAAHVISFAQSVRAEG